MTDNRHQQIYTCVFSAMIANNALSLPLHIGDLCKNLGVDLYPLSQIVETTDLLVTDVFGIWGNEDGAVMRFGDKVKIAYNDSLPRKRTRFTLCEEIGHFLLKHTEDPRFNIFDQRYDEQTYKRYDKEARIAAGLLLCQPQYFYKNMNLLTPDTVSFLCDITDNCAEVRCDILIRFKHSIMQNPIFHALPQPTLRRQFNTSLVC